MSTFISAQISEALNDAYQRARPPCGYAHDIAACVFDRIVEFLKAHPAFDGKTTLEIEILLADIESRMAEDLEPLLADLTNDVAWDALRDVSYALAIEE